MELTLGPSHPRVGERSTRYPGPLTCSPVALAQPFGFRSKPDSDALSVRERRERRGPRVFHLRTFKMAQGSRKRQANTTTTAKDICAGLSGGVASPVGLNAPT